MFYYISYLLTFILTKTFILYLLTLTFKNSIYQIINEISHDIHNALQYNNPCRMAWAGVEMILLSVDRIGSTL